ncbi:MAG: NAD(P)H-hydrate dehydratase [Acidimicrobiia bacterium]
MRPVLSVEEMRRVDADSAVPVDQLMDAAGFAVAREATAMGVGYGSTVHVLCGSGNNGGDGFVAARYLDRRGAKVTVHFAGLPEAGSPAMRAFEAVSASGVRCIPLGGVQPGDVIIDALYGTGFRGELPEAATAWTTTDMSVLAVDIPSGLDGDTGEPAGPVFRADRTVAFHALKTGHLIGFGPDLCGDVAVADIGLSGGEPDLDLVTAEDVYLPPRERTTHKWKSGAVVTVGGMSGLTGAALLVARTALRAGAGASSILTTAATDPIYEALAPEIPTIQASESASWRDHASEVLALIGRFDVLVVGPGLEPPPPNFVERLLEGFAGPMVVDAGAIGAIGRLDTLLERTAPTVLTPHAGEFKRLAGVDPSHIEAHRLAEATGSTVLLKGNPTFVAGQGIGVVTTGGPELASIGTGDVLAGLVAFFLARGLGPDDAARSAAFIHGVAGSRIAEHTSVVATDLVDEIGAMMVEFG